MTEDDADAGPSGDQPVPTPPPQGVLGELFGCLVPVAVVAGLLFLVLWGYRAMFPPGVPVPLEAGEVQTIELNSGAAKEYAGRRCRVYAEWVAIEADGAVVMIPRDRVQTLRLAPLR